VHASIAPVPVPVAVVGSGVAGLVAAHHLARLGHAVTIYEAGDQIGGQVRTVPLAGLAVDVGAESIPTGSPVVEDLLRSLGLDDQTVAATPSRTLVWADRRLRRLPAGVGPAGPTRLGPVLRSRALSPAGLARAAVEPLVPRSPSDADVGVGTFVARRFGRQVADRLVDPLLGGLHAGDVTRLSLRANVPRLADLARDGRSVLLAHRRFRQANGGSPGGPSFVSFPGGLRTFVEALAAAPGVTVHLDSPVAGIAPGRGEYEVRIGDGRTEGAGAVVVALPPPAAGAVLAPLHPGLGALTGGTAATVATVVAAFPAGAVEGTVATSASGLLVPSGAGRLLRSAVFLGTKWPHLHHPDLFLVRLSAGRARQAAVLQLGDEELVARLLADLADAIGLASAPSELVVQRWPDGLAQLEVGHLERVAAIRAALADHPRVVLAGAGYDGLGIIRCADSGARAAGAVHAAAAA
jgi:oxygen-dependent protoporphyrinogen oxidase